MWPTESCPRPWWPISVRNLPFHSPSSPTTLSPFPSTNSCLCILSGFYVCLAYSPQFKASHKAGWLDLRWGKQKDAKASEINTFKSSFFLFRKELIFFLSKTLRTHSHFVPKSSLLPSHHTYVSWEMGTKTPFLMLLGTPYCSPSLQNGLQTQLFSMCFQALLLRGASPHTH